MEDRLLEIGKLTKPHGVKGKIRMVYYGDSPETLTDLPHVFIGTAETNRTLTIRSMSAHKKHFIVSFESIDTFDEAKALAGAGVYIYKSSFPPLPEDEYYWVDLIGCRVITEDGAIVGTISRIIATGSNDVYVITSEDDELMIPATTEVIKKVDINAKTIVAAVPDEGVNG